MVLLQLVVCALIAVPVAVLDALYRPGALQPFVDRAVGAAPVRLTYGDLVMLPVGTWLKPSTWRFAVTDLTFRPHDPKKPEWSVRRITMSAPELRRGPEGREIHWASLRADGLVIQAHQQRPPPPWEPVTGGPIAALTADEVVISRASYAAAADPPLGEVAVPRIDGVLRDIRFVPGRREVSGEGAVQAPEFRTGSIRVTRVDLPVFRFDRSSLHLDGTVDFAGSLASVRGTIANFHIRSDVTLHVELQDASVDTVVETATGKPSPVTGRLDLSLEVRAGGKLPRGGAVMSGDARLKDGRIQLDPRTRYVVLDALRLVPWVRLNAWRQVELEEMHGSLTLTRGSVILRGLRYPVGRRELRLDGTMKEEDLYLLVRLGPPPERADRPGLGVVIEGTRTRQTFRLAEKEELVREQPWTPITEAERRSFQARAQQEQAAGPRRVSPPAPSGGSP